MSITLNIDNRYVHIRGAERQTICALEQVTSYLVAGFMYAPSWRAKRWDGREHLLKFISGKGYRAPIGLLEDIVNTLKSEGLNHTIQASRKYHGPEIEVGWNPDLKLRPYQIEAVEAICEKGLYRGSGLLKMPIRSGKTKTAAAIIHKLKRRALFIVPSQMLLHQSRESFQESLQVPIGAIGDGGWIEEDITVATIQTLSKSAGGYKKVKGRQVRIPPTEQYKELCNRYDVVLFDEAHHLRGDVWHKVMMDIHCRHRIGLSATIHLDNDRENERGVIWLKACCGNVRYEVSTSHLIEKGWLMRQNVELLKCEYPSQYYDWGWGQELRDLLIYENDYRNRMIVQTAKAKVKQGLKVLIVSNRHNQIEQLNELLMEANVGHAIVIGTDRSDSRKEKVQMFLDGEVDVLMGTVFGEGIDIPEIECVINAEGGRDVKAAIQRMRNMTPAEGKTTAVFVDFMDMTNKYFAQHSLERLRTYRSESAFNVKILDEVELT